MRKIGNQGCHDRAVNGIDEFAKIMGGISSLTNKNVNLFVGDLVDIDPFCLTKFELSFKVKEKLIEKNKLRILSIDTEGYSYLNKKSYLKRLKQYKGIINNRVNNNFNENIFKALESIANHPLDVYIGADIQNNKYLMALWLILGGARRDGKIEFIKDSQKILSDLFLSLGINTDFPLNEKILNVGFDIDDKEAFFKIYYFLNKENFNRLTHDEQVNVAKIIRLLGNRYKYWFFISERFCFGKKEIGRKKVYVEFLDDLLLADFNKHAAMLKELFDIVGCKFPITRLEKIFKSISFGKLVILAFEPDGTVTFYLRIS